MDVLIKSFNRAYYLDRCLDSVNNYCKGINKIKIVDDGTPEIYLNKIREKYKNIEIILSENYKDKSTRLIAREEINGFNIPVKEWKNVVENSDKYILVIEDDVWFTDYIDFTEIINEMSNFNVDMVKIGWQGTQKYLYNFKEEKLSNNLIYQYPNKKLFLANGNIMKMIFNNKYKIRSALHYLNRFDNYTIHEYYELFSILMGVYDKRYWSYLWKDIDNRVSEVSQLINSVDWRYKNLNNKNSICRTSKEFLKTTYSSTSTNSYRKYKSKVNINLINYYLNELWLNDKLDIHNNFPNDYDVVYLGKLMGNNFSTNLNIDLDQWKDWINEFKEACRKYGANVD